MRPSIEIVIVVPLTVAAETKQILDKSVLSIYLLNTPSRDHLQWLAAAMSSSWIASPAD